MVNFANQILVISKNSYKHKQNQQLEKYKAHFEVFIYKKKIKVLESITITSPTKNKAKCCFNSFIFGKSFKI